MTAYLIGVDAGGTKTRAAVYSPDGSPLTSASAGPGNLALNFNAAAAAICKCLDACVSSLPSGARVFACVGAAGAGTGDYGALLTSVLSSAYSFPVRVITDAEAALYASLRGEDGLLAVSGTGSIVTAKKGDAILRAGGWGHLLGDEGSGWDVGISAIRRLTALRDRALRDPALEDALFEAAQVKDIPSLVAYVYAGGKAEIAALAPAVIRLAEEGCESAHAIVTQSAERLADTAVLLARRCGFSAPQVALSGGCFQHFALLREAFCAHVRAHVPGAKMQMRSFEPTESVLYCYRKEERGNEHV